MTRKSFKSAAQTAPIEFDIDGIVFHARSQMPSGILMKFAEMTAGMDIGADNPEDALSGAQIIGAVRMFFSSALINDDVPRFFDLLDSSEHVVDLGMLVDIAGWLAGEYTARPTGQTSSDTSSETGSGQGSTDGALPAPLTFSRPEPAPIVRST